LKTFPEKWRILFRNVGFLLRFKIFLDFFREIETFSRTARLFKYIFSGIEAFSAMSLWP
jgi:hypothetical protein